MTDLNPRQQRFVEAYASNPNATEAAIAAGYSRKTAKQQGSRLLSHVDVKRAIGDARQAALTGLVMTRERALELLSKTAEDNVGADNLGAKNVGLQAMNQLRAMQGWDAPSKSESGKPGDFASMSAEKVEAEIAQLEQERIQLAVDNTKTGTDG